VRGTIEDPEGERVDYQETTGGIELPEEQVTSEQEEPAQNHEVDG